jgi:hypothetical protein
MRTCRRTPGDDRQYARQAAGRPRLAGEAIVNLYDVEEPPMQLLLGKVLYDTYTAKLATVSKSLKEWEAVTLATDFPPGQ